MDGSRDRKAVNACITARSGPLPRCDRHTLRETVQRTRKHAPAQLADLERCHVGDNLHAPLRQRWGHNKIKMDALGALYESLGLRGAQTYVRSLTIPASSRQAEGQTYVIALNVSAEERKVSLGSPWRPPAKSCWTAMVPTAVRLSCGICT